MSFILITKWNPPNELDPKKRESEKGELEIEHFISQSISDMGEGRRANRTGWLADKSLIIF